MPTWSIGDRRRRIGIFVLLAVAVLLGVVRAAASLATDAWWFASVEQRGTWRRLLVARTGLAVVAMVLSVLVVWINLAVADRRAARRLRGADDITARYLELVAGRTGIVRVLVAILTGVLVGPLLAGHWQDLLLYLHARNFDGAYYRRLGVNARFFVFELPMLTAVTQWLIVLVLLTTIVTGAAYYLNGSVRPQAPRDRIDRGAGAHMSVLFALLALLVSVALWWSRYSLAIGTRGRFVGLLYTDRNVRLPALTLCALIGVVVAGVLLANARSQTWPVSMIAVAAWLAVMLVVMGIAPQVVQSWRVNSNENALEERFVADNLRNTRYAYGLEKMNWSSFSYSQGIDKAQLQQKPDILRNIRLWDPGTDLALAHAQATQQQFRYFRFNDMDVDRYVLDGVPTEVLISARELQLESQSSWVDRILRFTHGFGVVLAPANQVVEAAPKYVLGSPSSIIGNPLVKQPRIYVGEGFSGYVVGNTGQEVDFGAAAAAGANYSGRGGVAMNSFLRQAAFSLRFGDLNLVKRDFGANATVLFRRDIVQRARTLAPFLRFDADPYPVLLDGRILWVLDGYTTSDRFPAAQRHALPIDDLPAGSELTGGFNYVRNSVKVVIDSYDATTTFYRVDDDDPIISAWSAAFPSLFHPASQIERDHPGLGAHFRYPEDMLRVQASILGRYHQEDPLALISDTDRWETSPEASRSIGESNTSAGALRPRRMAPYYVYLRLPGAAKPEFVLVQTVENYKEDGRAGQLTAMLVGQSTSTGKAVLDLVNVPARPDGPALIAQQMASEPAVSREQTELGQRGSKVILGAVQTVPVGKGFMFIRSMYTVADSQNDASTITPPQLVRVIVSDGKHTVISTSLQGAVDLIVGSGSTPATPTGLTRLSVDQLVSQASDALAQADDALRQGDLGAYQAKVKAAGALLAEATGRSGSGPTTTVSPGPTTTLKRG